MVTTTTGPKFLASTRLGDVVVSDGVVYLLTTCCKASGKGSERGVICRACYRKVPDHFGWGALATGGQFAEAQLAEMLWPSVHQFAKEAAAGVFAAARREA